jgi:excisionase family DNA binding protein
MTMTDNGRSGQTFIVNAPDEYLTKAEAAQLLGVNPRTIENYIRAGTLRASKPSFKILRIKRSDVDKMLDRFATA